MIGDNPVYDLLGWDQNGVVGGGGGSPAGQKGGNPRRIRDS